MLLSSNVLNMNCAD